MSHLFFGITAGILSFVAYPIYIRDILRGETRPSKVTWWVLSILNGAIAITYFLSGARDTIWIPISYTIGFLSIAILSLKYGEGGDTATDRICISGAALSLLFWAIWKDPTITLILLIVTDFFGLYPTIVKSFRAPQTESKVSWSIAAVASVLNIFAIEAWVFSIFLYPLYVCITNILITFFLFQSKHDPSIS